MKIIIQIREKFRKDPITSSIFVAVMFYAVVSTLIKQVPDSLTHILEIAWLTGETVKEIV